MDFNSTFKEIRKAV